MARKSLRKRLQMFLAERWLDLTLFFRFHWFALLLVLLVIGVAGYWLRYLLPLADYQSAQWALSTEVQSLAALLGIMLVGVTLLWSQATGEESRLLELQPKYYDLLRTGGDPAHEGTPIIEQLRVDYLKKIKARTLPRQVFPYEHVKYRKHRDLFVDICRLSEVVHERCGLGNIFETIEADLKGLRISEDEVTEKVLIPWYGLKSDPLEFLETVVDIFQPGNNTVYFHLEGGRKFADRVWDFTLLQHTETSIERVKRFKQFRSIWFRVGFSVYVLAIVVGLAEVSGITAKSSWRPLFVMSNILGFAAVAFTIVFVHALLRSE